MGDTPTDTGVGPSSGAWRLSRNLRPLSFTPRLGRDPLTGQAYGFSGNNPRNASDPTGLCSWYDAVCGVGVGATWVADNAGNISAVAGIAAVIIAPIPVLDVLSPVLGGISLATGAFATGKDLGNGNYAQALVDGAGTLLGGAGLAEDLLARGLMRNLSSRVRHVVFMRSVRHPRWGEG